LSAAISIFKVENSKLNFEKLEIDVPIKIITGKYDFPVFSKNEVAKYFEEFNDVEIVEFEEAGHYPMIECPLLFASKIEFWVKNL
jgi:pimeloyl-ACP methyl ester carboxylesterase